MSPDLIIGALCHYRAALAARARPQVDQVIGGAHRCSIVLHQYKRVAEVAQRPQAG